MALFFLTSHVALLFDSVFSFVTTLPGPDRLLLSMTLPLSLPLSLSLPTLAPRTIGKTRRAKVQQITKSDFISDLLTPGKKYLSLSSENGYHKGTKAHRFILLITFGNHRGTKTHRFLLLITFGNHRGPKTHRFILLITFGNHRGTKTHRFLLLVLSPAHC